MSLSLRRRALVPATMLLGLALSLLAAPPASASRAFSAVYTSTNATDGNALVVYDRAHDGQITERTRIATGGEGTGAGLGSQGAVVLDRNRLLVVNAGSNELSSFEIDARSGPVLADVVPTGDGMPTSVAISRDLVYVLNIAGGGSISGFTLDHDGDLEPLAGSSRPLSGADMTEGAQISFTPRGDHLIVSERATNLLTVFSVGRDGVVTDQESHQSAGETPFGFDIDRRGRLFVSEAFGGAADASAVSSYSVGRDGDLDVVSASVGTTETAACWVEVTHDNRYLYTTNTGSGTISGYAIDRDGSIALLDADGVTADAGAGTSPLDLASTPRSLYALLGGTGEVAAYKIGTDGSLLPLGAAGGLPAGAAGLAAD